MKISTTFSLLFMAASSFLLPQAILGSSDSENTKNGSLRRVLGKDSDSDDKDSLAGNYFSTYRLYLGGGSSAVDGAFYFSIKEIADSDGLLYKFAQCFSTDGGETFTGTDIGTLTKISSRAFRVNIIDEEPELGDGFAFEGRYYDDTIKSISLLGFYDGVSFTAHPEEIDVELGSDACPIFS